MNSQYRTILICGNTRFENEYKVAYIELGKEGFIVESLYTHTLVLLSRSKFKYIENFAKKKIENNYMLYVINKDGDIDFVTNSYIEYAKTMRKKIHYMYSFCGCSLRFDIMPYHCCVNGECDNIPLCKYYYSKDSRR